MARDEEQLSGVRAPDRESGTGGDAHADLPPREDGPPPWLFGETPDGGPLLDRLCAFCGEQAPPGSSFCPNCGRALTAALFPAHGRPLTVLFTDIEDSVLLTERLGDVAWSSIIDEHNTIVREAIQQFAGFEVKLTGDGFLIVFADAVRAVGCAATIQYRIQTTRGDRADWPVQVRIGIHRGDVILRPGGDILGRTVNMAERIMAKGSGEEIWASTEVYEEVRHAVSRRLWLDRGSRRLKGVAGRHHLYELLWRQALEIDDAGPGPEGESFEPRIDSTEAATRPLAPPPADADQSWSRTSREGPPSDSAITPSASSSSMSPAARG